MSAQTLLQIEGLSKSFTMHLQSGLRLPIVRDVRLRVDAGEVVVLGGPSGAGKSSLLKMVYGNYAAHEGHIRVRHLEHLVDLVGADPRLVLSIRMKTIGYVSQFLSVIPRVSALDVVAEVGRSWGLPPTQALSEAGELLARLNIPQRLWSLPPATFSGGERQRVNIARGFAGQHPLLLLDEPTASLDATNRGVVLELIKEKRRNGVGVLGIFHDPETRDAVADRVVDVTAFNATV